ncbi:MAG TPA: hypothetical protein VGO81_06600 [Solirubrobacteraceae bacterium]|nr:hypothetical protein [Solirubrobacteraceae bacterium]
MRLAREGDDVAAGELLDDLAVAIGHHPLEVVTQHDDAIGPGVVHHRLLERSEAAAAHDDDDDAVERVIDSYALDRDLKDALWLWANGRRDRLARSPSRPATSNGERHDDLW